MKKYCLENERVIRSYIEVKRFRLAESTISQILNAIEKYQEFTEYKDFKQFDLKSVNKYVRYLRDLKLSVSTINGCLTYLRNFLEWLSSQTGYKSRIKLDVVELLSINNNELNQLNKSINKDYPTIEQAKTIFDAVTVKNEVDRRDKALIAFATLTGIRSEALRTLTLGSIDIQKMEVFQSKKMGVKTKFGKDIFSKIFNFDEGMQDFFVEWYKYLKEIKLYNNTDPLFPKTKRRQTEDDLSFICDELEPEFWQAHSSISKVFIERAKQAGIKAFSPHRYRDLAASLAIEKCDGDFYLVKAVSQHFGHENTRLLIDTYAPLRAQELSKAFDKINDKSNKNNFTDEELQTLKKALGKIGV